MLVDMITGRVYEIPDSSKKLDDVAWTFTNMPVYDAPMMIVDRGALQYDVWPPNTKPISE